MYIVNVYFTLLGPNGKMYGACVFQRQGGKGTSEMTPVPCISFTKNKISITYIEFAKLTTSLVSGIEV